MVGLHLRTLAHIRHSSRAKSSPVYRAFRFPVFRGIRLFLHNLGDEVEFVTVMWFETLEAVRAFTGADYEVAVVPPKVRALLSRFDASSQHYEVRAEMKTWLIFKKSIL
jgi:hypothetical protein